MSRLLNIGQIADEVLASVVADARVKTASAKADKDATYTVDAAVALRKLADDLRAGPEEFGGDDIGMDDLAALDDDPEVQELLMLLEQNPELLQQLLAEQEGPAPTWSEGPPNAAEKEPPKKTSDDEPPAKKDKDPEISPPLPKAASADLRKLASTLRRMAVAEKATRAVKAAAAYHAAKGIQHLVGGAR